MDKVFTIDIDMDMDKKCKECGQGGATPSGFCLACVTKALNPAKTMKTVEADLKRKAKELKKRRKPSPRSKRQASLGSREMSHALPTENSSYLEHLLMRWPCSIRLQLKVQAARRREARIANRARAAQLARIRQGLAVADVNTLGQVERLLMSNEVKG